MCDKKMLALRRALFLAGLARGLDANALHASMEEGLRLATLAHFLDEERKKVRAAG